MSSPAFTRADGQFVCHIRGKIEDNISTNCFHDIIDVIENHQSQSKQYWPPWNSIDKTESGLHISMFRGHMCVAYHQIKPLLEQIKFVCNNSKSLNITLDSLKVFNNHEKTKQFLCMVEGKQIEETCDILKFKKTLKPLLDNYITRLTDEVDTSESMVHCSLMTRKATGYMNDDGLLKEIKEIETLCKDELGYVPIYMERIQSLDVIIGNQTYNIKLNK